MNPFHPLHARSIVRAFGSMLFAQTNAPTTALERLFWPFNRLAHTLLNTFIDILYSTPDITPNPAVEHIHELTLLVALLCAGAGVTLTGLYYLFGEVVGVSDEDIRLILPRLLLAVGFAVVSLPLLQYGVALSNAFVVAFKPVDPQLSLSQYAGLSGSLVLVWFINAWLLLALVVIFVVRNAYLLFVAAISPLIALAWSFPHTNRYARTFISGWFTALAMAPLDVLVLRFTLELLKASHTTAVGRLSNWILGVASFVLLLWIPSQLYGASQALIGQGHRTALGLRGGRTRWPPRRQPPGGSDGAEAFSDGSDWRSDSRRGGDWR